MSPATQRRSSVALVVLTVCVLSVDTANAMQHKPSQPRQAVTSTVSTSTAAHVSPVALQARRATHKTAHRRHPRADTPPARPRRAAHPQRRLPNHVRRVARVTGPTGWAALDAAIARIPTYRPGAAIWLVSDRYGHWGTADWYHATLYIAPDVPLSRLYDVAVHEWSHELSVLDYDGDVAAAVTAMNSVFGGSGLDGAERAADCMAKLQGASYTHYTSCLNRDWRRAAGRLLAGQRL